MEGCSYPIMPSDLPWSTKPLLKPEKERLGNAFDGLWAKFADKKYREQFVSAQVKRDIPAQIRTLMRQKDLTQEKLAERCGLDQGTVSRTANPNYGNLTLNTIIRIAAGFDVAFIGKFVPFSELGRWFLRPPEETTIPNYIEEASQISPDSTEVLIDRKQAAVAESAHGKAEATKSFVDQLITAAAAYESVLKDSYDAGRFWMAALANTPTHPQEESQLNVTGHPPTVKVQVQDAVSQATQQPAPAQPQDPYKGLRIVPEPTVLESANPQPMKAVA